MLYRFVHLLTKVAILLESEITFQKFLPIADHYHHSFLFFGAELHLIIICIPTLLFVSDILSSLSFLLFFFSISWCTYGTNISFNFFTYCTFHFIFPAFLDLQASIKTFHTYIYNILIRIWFVNCLRFHSPIWA